MNWHDASELVLTELQKLVAECVSCCGAFNGPAYDGHRNDCKRGQIFSLIKKFAETRARRHCECRRCWPCPSPVAEMDGICCAGCANDHPGATMGWSETRTQKVDKSLQGS